MKKFFALLLHFSITCHAVNCCTNGEIRIHGTHSDSVVAGRVDLCHQSVWRAVCRQSWDRNDAIVVCRQFGFPPGGAQFCTESCLGSNNSRPGQNNFMCSGNEARLADCRSNTLSKCTNTIGVICYNSAPTVSTFQPGVTVATPTMEPTTTSSMSSALPAATPCQYQDHHDSHTDDVSMTHDSGTTNAVVKDDIDTVIAGAALGGACAVLLLVLVGVVIGWVWTCHKNKPKSSRMSEHMFPNPMYTDKSSPPSSSSLPLNHVSYSSQGPKNTSRSALKTQENAFEDEEGVYEMPDEREYEVVKEKNATDELVYHVLEDAREGGNNEAAYEVPVQSKGEGRKGKVCQKADSSLRYHGV